MINNQGKNLFAKAIAKELDIDRIIITDDTTSPSATDTLIDFGDFGTDNVYGQIVFNPYYSGSTVWIECQIPKPQGNFTWKKIGIINKNGKLICEQAYTNATKASSGVAIVQIPISIS